MALHNQAHTISYFTQLLHIRRCLITLDSQTPYTAEQTRKRRPFFCIRSLLKSLAVMKVEDFSSSEDEYSHAQFVPCALCRQACQRMRYSPLPHGKTYPIFCKKIQKTMLASTDRRSPVMTIPKEFCDRYFQFSQHGHVTFEDPIGRTWSIDTYKNSQGYFQFCSRGWDNFARSNNIKLDDFVLFKLVANCYLKVQVFSTGGLLKKN